MITVTLSLAAVFTLRQADEEAVVPVVDAVPLLPYSVRVLLPGQLCDNLQGTLMYHVQTFLSLPQAQRQQQLDQVVAIREKMKGVGCG